MGVINDVVGVSNRVLRSTKYVWVGFTGCVEKTTLSYNSGQYKALQASLLLQLLVLLVTLNL